MIVGKKLISPEIQFGFGRAVLMLGIEVVELAKEWAKKFYRSKEWKKCRKRILERDNNECQRCKANGKYHKAETIHHIKHLKDNQELALVDSNLISLCNVCHNHLHPEKFGYKVKHKKFVTKERW